MPEINELFRRVRNHPMYIKNDGKVSSAIFLDSHGVSVDIDDCRKLEEIILHEETLHKYYCGDNLASDPEGSYKLLGIISVTKKQCDEKSVLVEIDPIKEINPYHAILKRSAEKIELTSSQRRYLTNNARVIKSYDKKLKEQAETGDLETAEK